MYIFLCVCVFRIQVDIRERRTALSLQGLGAKLGGCGTFQVSCLLSHILVIFIIFLAMCFSSEYALKDYEVICAVLK